MKVLLVEDNAKLARFLERALREAGCVVDQAGDGVSALQLVERLSYDLVLLDWMLPALDGLTVCRVLRSRGHEVPVCMLSGRSDVAERIAGLDAGADDYVVKPFDLGELMARVRALLRRAGESVVQAGPLRVDRMARRATLAGRPLPLTPRELALLVHLARGGGRVVPRTEILAKVWEVGFDPGSNVVEVHIRSLREKLGAHATLIETVRGVGYRLAAPRPQEDSRSRLRCTSRCRGLMRK